MSRRTGTFTTRSRGQEVQAGLALDRRRCILAPRNRAGRQSALTAQRRRGNLLYGEFSVSSAYRFLLMLRNGEAADPPAFLTEQPDWKPGDVFVAANERAFRIVETDAEVEVAGMVVFDAIWTVEPLEE